MKATVTLEDVARLAGVSPKTVSRVINGEAHVRPATREAVNRAVEELDYRPNLAARSLAASRSLLISLLGMRLDAHFFRAMYFSGVRACRARGYHLMAEEVPDINDASLAQLEASLRQARCDGLILTQLSDQEPLLEMLERLQVPYVRLLPLTQPERSDAVTNDQNEGVRLLAEHLRQLGHRRVLISSLLGARQRDMREALLNAGFRDDDLVEIKQDWRSQNPADMGRQLGEQLLAMVPRPTAVCAYNDEIAASLISHAWAHGVRIPADLTVVGYDDAEISRVVWPPITTVHQPFEQMMREAINLLLTPNPDGEPRTVVCPLRLEVRQSSAPPAAE